jgi:O-antigen ligase
MLAYEFLQAVGGDPFPWNPLLKSRYWLFATLGNPVHLANYLVCAFWLSFAVLPRGGTAAWLFRMAVAAGAIATFQRSALLGFAAGGAVMLVQRGSGRCGTGAALLSAVPFAALPVYEAARRMFDASTVAGARLPIWEAAGRLVAAHPWLGVGPDMLYSWFPSVATYAYYSAEPPDLTGGLVHLRLPASAHNDLVGIAVTQGMIGLGIYLWALAVVVRAGIRSTLLPAALSCFSIHLANPSTTAPLAVFWIVGAMIVAGAGRDRCAFPVDGGFSPFLRGFRTAALGALTVLLAISLYTGLRLGVAQSHRREAGRLAFYGLNSVLVGNLDRWSDYAARVHPRQAHDDAGLFCSQGTADGRNPGQEAVLREMAVKGNPRNIFFLGALADYCIRTGKREGDRSLMERGELLIRREIVLAPGAICLYDDLADALAALGRGREAAAFRAERRRLDVRGLFGPTRQP